LAVARLAAMRPQAEQVGLGRSAPPNQIPRQRAAQAQDARR
jgi:hypothetical protein